VQVSQTAFARASLAGFFLTGLVLAFPGAVILAWGFHLKCDFLTVGNLFLSMNAGMLASIAPGYALLSRRGIRFMLALSAIAACVGFFYLALLPPAPSPWWRMSGIFLLGFASGCMSITVFHSISPVYASNAAAALNLAGGFFGLGSLLTALLVAGSFYIYSVPSILVLLGLIPGFAAGLFLKSGFAAIPMPRQPSLRESIQDFKTPAAVLMAILLFFQFGNEWSIAGWLPLYLVQRLGVSPAAALHLLALYWLSLLVGRIAMQAVLPRVRHGILLIASGFSALLGCLILFFTNNAFGAASGILFIGAGFAAIYPLASELIGGRFPYYHPGFFNGVFSIASTGGLLAPWTMGIYAHLWGIRLVILLPALGACAVFVVTLVLYVYVRLTGLPSSGAAVS
jgi:fucose permease